MGPVRRTDRAALVLLCEKPSPVPTVSRFESHAKGFNDIITMF
jgi:hypothetical protein